MGRNRPRVGPIWTSIFHREVDQVDRSKCTERFQVIIFVMGEAAVQAAVVGAIEPVADETRRRIAERPQDIRPALGIRREAGTSISRPAHGAIGQ